MRGCSVTGMKKLIAVVAAVLVLAGCSAAPSEPAETSRIAPEVTESAAPVEKSAPPEVEFTESEAATLDVLRRPTALSGAESLSDDYLVSTAVAACVLFASGIEYFDMDTIEGETLIGTEDEVSAMQRMNATTVSSVASQFLCPEYDINAG